MPLFKADMHIHTVLSPCGDLDMSPRNILQQARVKGLDVIAITDHNSTLMCRPIAELGKDYEITVIPGIEITTKEEAHCLAYFFNFQQVEQMQQFVETKLPFFPYDPEIFGHQLVVDADEIILQEIETLLITGLNATLEEIESTVHKIGGIFVPAHIDRPKYSIISQLGFIPIDLNVDAIEISKHTSPEIFCQNNKNYTKYSFVQNSDAHYPKHIGESYTIYDIQAPNLEEIFMALKNMDNRKIFATHNLKN